jgi:hypothetical protein
MESICSLEMVLKYVKSVLISGVDNMPNALWVWDISKFSLAALILQKEAVKCARWDPSQNRLAISTGNEYLYLWTPTGTSCVKISLRKCYTNKFI